MGNSGRKRPGDYDPDLEKAPRKHRRETRYPNTFTVSGPASARFRELVAETLAAHGKVSFSEMLELLVWHWREHQPSGPEVLRFEFTTKRGRPRKMG